MEDYATNSLYGALWEILSTIKFFVLEYKDLITCYTTFTLSQKEKVDSDIEYSYIFSYIKNALSKLIKYQKLSSHLPAYITFVTINPTFQL